MSTQRFESLFRKYLIGEITEKELINLGEMMREATYSDTLDEMLQNAYSNPEFSTTGDYDPELVFEELRSRLGIKLSPVVPVRRGMWRAIAIAATLITFIAAYYFWFYRDADKEHLPIVSTDVAAPAGNRATIRLANGSFVYLDSVANGSIANESGTLVVKESDGKLRYSNAQRAEQKLIYNTLLNPRGSRVIDITLSDGSRVWLNAGSSITYPVTFLGKSRKITVEGEAYFEVVHNPAMPFIVEKDFMQVTVLGTKFNVNAYGDEPNIKVTLLQGSVRLNADGSYDPARSRGEQEQTSLTLRPGQQAIIQKGQMAVDNEADLEQVMAWKNGRFQFNGTDLKEVMREVSRWYDVEIEYRSTTTEKLGGSISRFASASQVLKMLELTGLVKFEIAGNKVIIK